MCVSCCLLLQKKPAPKRDHDSTCTRVIQQKPSRCQYMSKVLIINDCDAYSEGALTRGGHQRANKPSIDLLRSLIINQVLILLLALLLLLRLLVLVVTLPVVRVRLVGLSCCSVLTLGLLCLSCYCCCPERLCRAGCSRRELCRG